MLSFFKRHRTGVLVAAAIVATAGISSAVGATAAVKYVVLGAKNATTAPTYINNSRGVPLALNSKPGTAPLAVGSKVAVKNLNADYLDGANASSFARTSGRTGVIVATEPNADAVCPAGTQLTGGGGLAGRISGEDFVPSALAFSGPGEAANSWAAVPVAEDDLALSFAVCYNPVGAVPQPPVSAEVNRLAAESPALKDALTRR